MNNALVNVLDSETEYRAEMKDKIEALSQHGNALDSLNMTQEKLFELVENLSLYEMQYSYLSDQIATLLQQGYD